MFGIDTLGFPSVSGSNPGRTQGEVLANIAVTNNDGAPTHE